MTQNVKTTLRVICFIALNISCKDQANKQSYYHSNNSLNLNNNIVEQKEQDKNLDSYVSNPDYLEYNFDINRDEKLDKIFSHKEYKGDELVFFIRENDKFKFALKSINFTEDGGRIIESIESSNNNETVLKINTFFPNGETNEASYYISYDDDWYLSKTIFRISNWKENSLINKVCTISQNLLLRTLNKPENLSKIKNLPIEYEREKYCENLYVLPKSVSDFEKMIKVEQNENLKEIEIYRDFLKKYPLSKNNVTAYNNSAYYLEKKGLYPQSIMISEKIIEKFPTRTVAFINLGDAYWGLGKTEKAKEAYSEYVSQMEAQNKSSKIPPRVLERINKTD